MKISKRSAIFFLFILLSFNISCNKDSTKISEEVPMETIVDYEPLFGTWKIFSPPGFLPGGPVFLGYSHIQFNSDSTLLKLYQDTIISTEFYKLELDNDELRLTTGFVHPEFDTLAGTQNIEFLGDSSKIKLIDLCIDCYEYIYEKEN